MMMVEMCMKIVTKCYAMPEPASLKGEGRGGYDEGGS
jgi:hypothetical protein